MFASLWLWASTTCNPSSTALERLPSFAATSSISKIPNEVLARVLTFLDIEDVSTINQTNFQFMQVFWNLPLQPSELDRFFGFEVSHTTSLQALAKSETPICIIHMRAFKHQIYMAKRIAAGQTFALHFNYQRLNFDTFIRFIQQYYHMKITSLYCLHKLIRNEQLNKIMEHTDLSYCEKLDLRGGLIGAEGVGSIVQKPVQNLKILDLRWNHIDPEGAEILAVSSQLSGLTELRIGYNRLGPGGASAIVNSKILRNLRILDLEWNQLTNEGAQAIASSPNLSKLTVLVLCWNRIEDEGAQAIADSKTLGSLTELNLRENRMGDAAKAALLARFPFVIF